MSESPKVSIIIPTHNDGPVVCQAIDSSLSQTYKNREIIVVDDGSTDNTAQRLQKKYQDRIMYVHQQNKGTGSARNTGIRNASGKYLQFLDADDLLSPEKITIQIRQLKNIPDKALSYCDYIVYDLDDITKRHRRISPVLNNEKPFDDIMMKWETEVTIPIHCFIFDSTIFNKYKILFNEKLPANEDWECWMNVFALNPQVVFVNKVLAYYRVQEASRCRDRSIMRKAWTISINNQIEKHRANKKLVQKFVLRKKEIMYWYRDESPIGKIFQKSPRVFRHMYEKLIPWRIQRMFD